MTMKLFDAHCHLQDPRILNKTPQLIATALDTGVVRFAVNGVSEVCVCVCVCNLVSNNCSCLKIFWVLIFS